MVGDFGHLKPKKGEYLKIFGAGWMLTLSLP